MADDPTDLNVLPSDIDVQSIVDGVTSQQPASNEQAEDSSTGVSVIQAVSFPYCLQFNGQPWQSIVVAAPSPELAAVTVSQIVQLINDELVKMGYPPNLCSAVSGSC